MSGTLLQALCPVCGDGLTEREYDRVRMRRAAGGGPCPVCIVDDVSRPPPEPHWLDAGPPYE